MLMLRLQVLYLVDCNSLRGVSSKSEIQLALRHWEAGVAEVEGENGRIQDWDVSTVTNISKLHLGISACNAELRQRVIRFAMRWPSTSPSCPNGLVEGRCTATSPSCPDGLVEGQCTAKHAFCGRFAVIPAGVFQVLMV